MYRERNYDEDHLDFLKNDSKYNVAWGNVLASLNYDWQISPAMHSNMRLYMTRNHSKLSVDESIRHYSEYDPDVPLESGSFSDWSRITDLGTVADFTWNTGIRHIVRFGGEFINHFYRPETKLTDDDGVTETGKYGFTGQETALYIEYEFPIARWMKANVDKIAASYLDLPADFWMPSTASVLPTRSRQLALGGYLKLPYNLHLNLEGWYKTMDHLLEYTGTFSFLPPVDRWESTVTDGRGRSWGAEFEFGWKGANTEVTAYYTLSWTQRNFPEVWSGWYRDRNDNRHKITLMATHRFSKKFDIYAAWNYHSGNRTTIETNVIRRGEEDFAWDYFYSEPNNLKFPDYHRLDVGMNWRKTTKRGNESIWNLSIYNVYCRMNAIQVVVDRDDDGNFYATAHGMIPIVPTFSWTLKF